MVALMNPTLAPRTVQRVRHPLKVRLVEVLRTRQISPHFIGITLGGESLHDFVSASFDDHVKLMLPPAPGAPLVLPVQGPDGPVMPPGMARPVMRDYTPRRFDAAACELDIEFALHGVGPAADWAVQAAPGQPVGLGGPRGSFVVPVDYDWHLLIGDETALPAIARRLEELPAEARVIALVETSDPADRRELFTRAHLQMTWLPKPAAGASNGLAAATERLALPAGEGYAWAAGEASAIAAVRRVLTGPLGLDKDHVRAAAYWKHGAVAHHETL